jgi:hypothetical protein
MAQVVATILLLARRLAIVGIVGSFIDLRAFLCAIGGLFIALQSLILHFTGPYAALAPGAGEPGEYMVKFCSAINAQIYVIALVAKSGYWVMGMYLLYSALQIGAMGTGVWFDKHGWENSSTASISMLSLLWAIGIASPLYEIVLIRSQFSQTGKTSWRWKDPLSDRLWVF